MDLNPEIEMDDVSTMNWISRAVFMVEGYHHMVYLGLAIMFVFYMLMEAREKTFRISGAEELSRTMDPAPVFSDPILSEATDNKTSKTCVKDLAKDIDKVEMKSVLQKMD